MSDEHGVVLQLGRFEVRLAQRQVLAEGVPAHLGARAYDILVALIERRDRVVGKAELFDLVWPGAVVEENNLQVHISALRKLLGREAIVTVPGRGYRFAAPMSLRTLPATPEPRPAADPLPRALTRFIGREHDLEQLVLLSFTTRLLVLTGAGGCGKSRLSIELARRLLPRHRDGVCLVELAALADPSLVPQTVAAALGISDKSAPSGPSGPSGPLASVAPSLTQRIAGHLASRQMVLLIDNAEHLLSACATLADSVLRQSTDVLVLVTSRERLGITGELSYRVPSLEVPKAGAAAVPLDELARFDAVRLFVERAQLQPQRFELTRLNAAAVASVCRRLDGIPLAIELAAARTRSLSVDEIGQRLDQRFELLTGGSRTALPRHQTLRSLIDWSYDLLGPAEQALLCRLSVFAGGWSLQAAEQVCDGPDLAATDVLPLLTSLADKSLLLAEDRGGSTRYRMLESVWQYAHDKLQQAGLAHHWRARHAAHFTALAETTAPALNGADQGDWLDLLELEHDNLRSALACILSDGGPANIGLLLASSLWVFWRRRGHAAEGLSWIQRQLTLVNEDTPRLLHANALTAAGQLAFDLGDSRSAARAHTQALALYRELGDRPATANALHSVGAVAFMRADHAVAQACADESLSIRREAGDRCGIAASLHGLAALASARGDLLGARALYEEGVALYRAEGERRGVAWGLVYLGVVMCDLDDFSLGARHFEEALALARQVGDLPTVSAALLNLGNVAFEQGDLALASRTFGESLVLTRKLGDLYDMLPLLIGLARLHAACGQACAAGRLFGASQRLRDELECPMPPGQQVRQAAWVATAREACGDGAAFDQGWQHGRTRRLDEVLGSLPALQVLSATRSAPPA